MSETRPRWGFLKTPTLQQNSEKLDLPHNYAAKYTNSGAVDLDRNFSIESTLLSNLFEDMSMSTNTGPPSYDVMLT